MLHFVCELSSSILGIYPPVSVSLSASSASSLTVQKSRSLSLSKGPFQNRIFIPSLTHPALKAVFCFVAIFSSSFPCLCLCLFPCFSVKFRGYAYASSWSYFRGLFCFCLFPCFSVFVRGYAYAKSK